jgi:dTDP-4-amino-4,6-dideoxygalactose transaminase
MHIQPFFKQYDYVGENIGEYIFENGLCLPSDTKITDEQLDEIIKIIKGLWNNA